MAIVPFTQELAQEYFDSQEEFPIDLDDAWIWLGYSEKRNAWDTLKSYFEEGIDFLRQGTKRSTGGRSKKSIKLTVSCFKEMGMIAKTEQGKKIRKYFLKCEQALKQMLASRGNSSANKYLPSEIIQSLPRTWNLHFDSLWQRESMRITGYRWVCDIRMANFISKSIYQLLPKDVYSRLMSVNSDRKSCHHQFFTDKGDEIILKQHIQRVYGLMLASESQAQFWRLMQNAFSNGIQIELELFGAIEDQKRLSDI